MGLLGVPGGRIWGCREVAYSCLSKYIWFIIGSVSNSLASIKFKNTGATPLAPRGIRRRKFQFTLHCTDFIFFCVNAVFLLSFQLQYVICSRPVKPGCPKCHEDARSKN
jgi:hypothetical protein